MDKTIDHFISDSNNIWTEVMDKLIELKEWQQKQEELVRKSQIKQLNQLNEQNIKLNVLTHNQLERDGRDGRQTPVPSDVPSLANHCHSNDSKQQMDRESTQFDGNQSVEEMRAEDDCHQMNGNTSYGNQSLVSYLESSPVVPGIDGKNVKNFEELLNIRLNSEKNIDLNKSNGNKPKKAFLRKGEGIKRFEGNKSQTKVKKSKKVFNKTNETKSVLNKPKLKIETKPKVLEKHIINKRRDNMTEEYCVKPKPFKRKVIPLTTKMDKNTNKSVVISRNTPIVINDLNETESDLFEYLQQMCENISFENNSIDDKFKDKDINELQELLQKIEIKKSGIQRHLKENNDCLNVKDKHMDYRQSEPLETKSNKESKKRVRWSPNTCTQTIINSEDEDNICDLNEPKPGAYSSSLKQQISELEDQLSRLKSKKDGVIDNCVNKSTDVLNPLNEELIKLREQINKLNKRIVNIESKSYDLITPQMKEISNRKPNFNYSVQRNTKTLPKTITSVSNGLNISVNENPNDTTIDFPNGDKMSVSKDNTIFYIFANGSTQTTHPDGLRVTNFPNGQIEKLHKTGVKHITYANGLQRIINPDSSEEILMTDGTVWRIQSDGSEILEFPNGEREIRTDKYNRREYTNGNIKTVYSNGTEETRYVSGRLRIKDKFGNLMVDSMVKHLNQHF